MSFWDKLKVAFNDSVDTLSEKTSEWSALAKLRWEQRAIQGKIDKANNELGGVVYQLFVEKQQEQLKLDTKNNIEKISTLKAELADKEAEIKELLERGIDNAELKGFKKDLELGDGKIEQVVIEESSDVLGKKLMEISLPEKVLIGVIVRDEQVIIPDGQTSFLVGDKVTLLGEKEDVEKALALF
ncbi:hypothetical protein JW960_09290 [candidate division KSB1 bacterium]|nr:hypothetical protein [candidate division KSB1 bacterium]